MTRKTISFNLILLFFILLSCNDQGLNHTLSDEGIEEDSLYFRYEKIVNEELRFIEFWKNKMVWGNNSIYFTYPYDGSMDLDNMGPTNHVNGYDIEFLEQEIKVDGPAKYLYFNFKNDIIDHGKIREGLFFYHSDTINREYRFIEFNENEIIWGNDSLTFTHNYATDKCTESLIPRQNSPRYITTFSENYIIYQWHKFKTNIKHPELKNSGGTVSIFNFDNNRIQHIGHVNSIDIEQELLIAQQYEFYGAVNYKFPFVLSNFDKSYSQFIELEIDDDLPNPVTDFKWLKDTIIITYLGKNNQVKFDTTILDYNSKVESHLVDTLNFNH